MIFFMGMALGECIQLYMEPAYLWICDLELPVVFNNTIFLFWKDPFAILWVQQLFINSINVFSRFGAILSINMVTCLNIDLIWTLRYPFKSKTSRVRIMGTNSLVVALVVATIDVLTNRL